MPFFGHVRRLPVAPDDCGPRRSGKVEYQASTCRPQVIITSPRVLVYLFRPTMTSRRTSDRARATRTLVTPLNCQPHAASTLVTSKTKITQELLQVGSMSFAHEVMTSAQEKSRLRQQAPTCLQEAMIKTQTRVSVCS